MTSPSSSLFLTLLILCQLFPHSSYAMRKLQDYEMRKERETLMDLAEKIPVKADDIQRKELHEVHSGPNPISNSLPQQSWKPKSETKP